MQDEYLTQNTIKLQSNVAKPNWFDKNYGKIAIALFVIAAAFLIGGHLGGVAALSYAAAPLIVASLASVFAGRGRGRESHFERAGAYMSSRLYGQPANFNGSTLVLAAAPGATASHDDEVANGHGGQPANGHDGQPANGHDGQPADGHDGQQPVPA